MIVINETVVSRTRLIVLATVDGQFITLIVHLHLQHNECEAARRTGPSATADTCFLVAKYVK